MSSFSITTSDAFDVLGQKIELVVEFTAGWTGAVMEYVMATFIVLASFTDQGIRNVKETIGRAEAFKEMARKSSVTVKDLFWTLGSHDVVAVCEAPDDESATALSLSVCSRGNVRSETLRAFSFEEMTRILGKMV